MHRSIFTLLAAILLGGCYPHPDFKSTDVTGAGWGKTLALTGHDGKPRTLADFKGRIVVLTFGYTSCTDACLMALAGIAGALKSLKGSAEHVQVVFVTLDPARDTQKVLARYVTGFHPRFLGLYGDAQATERAAKEFRIAYEKGMDRSPSRYSIDHAAQSYVLDAQGRLRLLVKRERIAADLADDLRQLLHESARHAKDES